MGKDTRYGIVATLFTIGGIAGSWAAPYIARFLGYRGSSTLSFLMMGFSYLLVFLFPTPFVAGAFQLIISFSMFFWNVNSTTIRRSILPDELQGRVSSAFQFLNMGISPFAAMLGGFVASYWNLYLPFLIAAIGMVIASILMWYFLNNSHIKQALEESR